MSSPDPDTPPGPSVTLEVTYESAASLKHDYETQLKVGGLFVKVESPPELPPLAPLTVSLKVGNNPPVEAPARLTVATPDSVCVELLPEGRGELATQVEALCDDAEAVATGPQEARLRVAQPRAQASNASLPLHRRIDLMSVAEKARLALHGQRDARLLLSRDRAGPVQSALVRNPRITLDEIIAVARNPQLSGEAAEAIAQHQSWGTSPQVCFALARNPRTPLRIVQVLLPRLSQNDLRVLAKGVSVRTQVAMAARKRLFGT